jgi:hypothetical protein
MRTAVALQLADVKPVVAAVLLLLVACDQQGGGGGNGSAAARRAESGTRHGSAGGFSSTLSAELAKQGVEPAAVAGPPAPKAGGSAAATASAPVGAGSASAGTAAEGSASTGVVASNTGGANTAANSAANSATNSAANSAANAGASTASNTPSNTSATNPGVGATGPNGVKLATTAANNAPATNTAAGNASAKPPPTPADLNRAPVKPSAELAAIKFDLEPNWDRDLGEAGTFSLVVKVPNTNEQRVFSVRYGYEDQGAPPDCDGYRKFLDEKKVMTVTLNRQRGAACYVEGNQGGVAVFRYLLTYGGKRLMCSGSLYKDPASASLGDLRDKVLMQAKKICETLAL